MQEAKGPYKCVPRQLRMTCEPRSGARTAQFLSSRSKIAPARNAPDPSARDEWRKGYGAAPGRVQGNREGHSAGGR